ncbi:hypothetical protein ACFQ6Q_00050 [Streptomyces sp. NPDC056437]|uniref:hypothetical protein n=1 Tax=Streptomyces sp. NPDC056437 TaxID=3345816 RepID=UPI00369E9792
MSVKIGQLLDTLNVTAQIDDGDMTTDVLVIMKIVRPDGTVAIVLGESEATDWITQKGLIGAAVELTTGEYQRAGEDD